MNFNIGQQVICVDEFEEEGKHPEVDEICRINNLRQKSRLYLNIDGYPNDYNYDAECFIPLSDWRKAEEAVKELKEQMEVEHVMEIYHRVQNGEGNFLND